MGVEEDTPLGHDASQHRAKVSHLGQWLVRTGAVVWCDGDGWRQPLNLVDRYRRKTAIARPRDAEDLEKPSAGLRMEDVEGEAGLPGSGWTPKDDELTGVQFYVDVLEVVGVGATVRNGLWNRSTSHSFHTKLERGAIPN